MTLAAVAALGLVSCLVACGGNGQDTAADSGTASPPGRGAEPGDTATGGMGASEEPVFTPVELPPDFPPEFPIAPESTVVEAAARQGSTGTWSTVTIIGRAEPEWLAGWYREALQRAGWTVEVGGAGASTHVLHATRVDAYLDLVAGPHPAHPGSGWVRTHAEIWQTHP